MKKFYFGLFISIFIFSIFNLKSFADGPTGSISGVQYNYHLPTVIYWSITPSGYGWSGTCQKEAYTHNREDGLCFIKVSDTQDMVVSYDYLLNGQRYPINANTTYLTEASYVGTSPINNNLNSSFSPTDYPPAGWLVTGGTSNNYFMVNHPSGYQITFSNGPRFDSVEDARSYITNGNTDGLISGGDSLEGLTPINWGNNNPNTSSSGFNPDTENIPAPQFVIDTSNGNNHSIKFTNQIYNYSDHGVYGLVLKASWVSFDDFSLSKTGNVMWDTDWKVYYTTTLENSTTVNIYNVPYRESQIVRCPATINFNTNEVSVAAFNSFLQLNPTSERTVNYTLAGDEGDLLIEFQDYLGEISCPYNTCVFSCYYYRQMADGTFHYGPITTSHFDVPAQGAIYKRGQSVLDPNPGVTNDDPNYTPGVSGGGTITPGGIPTGEEVDPTTLYNNMKGLFGLVGELPQLIAGLFAFLPEWLIIFIAVSIGLMVAIGVVKLFLG